MRVCMLTTGQPSNNPRLVKEADSLSAAGHEVHAIGMDGGLWPSQMDGPVMARRSSVQQPWTFAYAGGLAGSQSALYRWTRLRYGLSRRLLPAAPELSILRKRALSRAAIEIAGAALRFPADLYIAHHTSVLPCAVAAAARHKGRVGYDAEDFYTGMWEPETGPGPVDRVLERIEERYLPHCDYMTAASPQIADAYVSRFGVRRPVTVLNVFPIADRPPVFRPTPESGPLRLYWFSQCIGTQRGLEDVVRAMGLLPDCHFELHLQGDWQSGYRDRLLGLAAESGVDTGRVYAHEPSPPDDMVRRAAEYEIGLALEVSTIQNRAMCLTNKVFTCLLAGNAIIGTTTPAQQALLSNLAPAAVLYSNGDAAAMAAHLRRWHDDRRFLDAARRSAWALGERRYHWEFEQQYFLNAVDSACSTLCRTSA